MNPSAVSRSSAADSAARPPRPRWELRPQDPAGAARLAREAGLPPLVARILAARGMQDGAAAKAYLTPTLAQTHDPFAMRGIAEAVERIAAALAAREPIWIYGDYDVDGVTATAILHLTLTRLGAQPDYYIPHRMSEGYGLNDDALRQIAAEGARLVVTVDCGITAVAQAELAAELGLDLVITDHHQPGPELPRAAAVVNPNQPECAYPFKGLAGAGVAFKLAHALLKRLQPEAEDARAFLKTLLDLVALGTVADIVPLEGENRALVHHGLAALRATRRPGLAQLFERASLTREKLNCGTIGFALGPRINAAGRTEHAFYGAELLLTESSQRAAELAEQLEQFNLNRRRIEQEIVDEALRIAEGYAGDHVIVVEQQGWHHGVLGIVASRLLARFYRPVLVLCVEGETAKGSARSIPGFDLHAALVACEGHLVRYGGHTMAAGLELAVKGIEAFRRAINAYAAEAMNETLLQPVLTIDTVAEERDLTPETVKSLDRLAPFGQANPKPVVMLKGCTLLERPRVLKEKHLKLNLCTQGGKSIAALYWNAAEQAGEIEALVGKPIDVAGALTVNVWNGRESVEMEVKNLRPALT